MQMTTGLWVVLRRGSSLLEALVVCAIIGLLLSLIVTAGMSVRKASQRASCLDNMRQIGIALHQYHAVFMRLPPGVVHPVLDPSIPQEFGENLDPYPLMTWQTRILPFVEQHSIWADIERAYREDPYLIACPPHQGKFTSISLFLCPADTPRGRAAEWNGPVPGTTSYLGVDGVNIAREDGLFYMDSKTRFADILDGLSATLAVGERPPSLDLLYGRWYGDWGRWGTVNTYLGVQETVFAGTYPECPEGPASFQAGDLYDRCAVFHFWSFHSDGAHFLFADGSARFLSYAAAAFLPALATRAGAEGPVQLE